ncbi:alpha,alpha-trehalase TreF [Sphingomonas sp. A2-49]|uniref:alpha,alpha-trehalase TreF n=1 Tax=Sphingomonas sp. A2-49 TaxID=1391375 RepID=UPI00397755C7|nr:alpha,alpha-trehalase TreF [Sphingomonas sp. A2-49]
MRRLFPDGKTFVDAVPRRPAAEIMERFATVARADDDLRAFVLDNFELPTIASVHAAREERNLRRYIRSIWPELRRGGDAAIPDGSLLALEGPYVVPGGRFAELYYWDSYFTMLGLVHDGEEALARSLLERFTELIERYGYVPNGTRSYYLSRSQPPLYHAMVELLPEAQPAALRRRLSAMVEEHRYWMADAERLGPGDRSGNVVAMPDGSILNRYWDRRDTPREESFSEDVATSSASFRDPARMFRDLRAGAESGWDFSSRWCDDGQLSSIRTTDFVAVDLNAFLFGLERAIAVAADRLWQDALAAAFRRRATERQAAVTRWCWSEAGYFTDFDLRDGVRRPITAASAVPLFTGLASAAQADATEASIRQWLLAPGGLRTSCVRTGQQWDAPNGWAPLQWMAASGLRRYGHHDLARLIARRWTQTVDAEFQGSGRIHEKYDVEACRAGAGGEYVPQLGFGWTNGVTTALMDLVACD